MKNVRASLLAILIGLSAFAGMTRPVHAQGIFVDQVSATEQIPTAAPDPDLQKILPLIYNSTVPSVSPALPAPDENNLFSTILVDNTPEATTQTVTGIEKTMPIASEDKLYISTYFSRFHPGIDICANIGTAIHAILPGTVNEVSYEAGGYGNYIVLVHHLEGKTYFSLYAHMRKTLVKTGDTVTSGEEIGEVGLTGHTTGPHVHFEVHDEKEAIDPLKFFSDNTTTMAMATK